MRVSIVPLISLLASSVAADTSSSSAWTFASAKIVIAETPYTFTPSSSPLALSLAQNDRLKLSLTSKLDDLAARPHQAMLLMKKPSASTEANLVIPVKSNGRGVLTLSYADIPAALLDPTTRSIDLTLVLAGFGRARPLLHPLGTLTLSDDEMNPYVPPTQALRYAAMPEITHTFRAPETMPPVIVSLAFSAILLLGLLALAAAWVTMGANVHALTTSLSHAPVSYPLFLAALAGIEASLALYFFKLRIMAALGAVGLLGVPLFFSGRFALRDVARRRKEGTR